MLDQLFGLLLLGLGLKSPATVPAVRGDSTEVSSSSGATGTSAEDSQDDDNSTGSSGASRGSDRSRLKNVVDKLAGTKSGEFKRLDTKTLREREQNLKELFAAREEKIKAALKERLEVAKKTHEQERTTFERKLKAITDTQKRALALKLDTKIPELNKRLTTNMTERLTNMQQVLEKASSRLGEYKTAHSDVDTSAIDAEIAAAQAAITSALTEVSTQSQKTYTAADFSSEENLGAAMKTLIAQFEADIQATRKSVNDSRESVGAVLKHIGSLLGATP